MAGQDQSKSADIIVDELIGLSDSDKIADHHASISNLYELLKNEEFPEYMDPQKFCPPKVTPSKIDKITDV